MPESAYYNRLGGDYHDTMEYQIATPEGRRQINRYKKENQISDEHLFLLLYKRELDAVPREKQEKADVGGKVVLVAAGLGFWNMFIMLSNGTAQSSPFVIIVSIAAFAAAIYMYAAGLLNDYRRAKNRVRKLLADMPEVPDYDEWMRTHPIEEPKPSKKRKRRR